MLDYTIIVPSRKRSHNMPVITDLLPSAIICVDEREADDYRPWVREENLLLHPPMEGLFSVINWMLKEIKTPVFVEIDDDFRGVRSLTGSKRFITDSEDILAIIENSIQVCEDLGVTSFCYSRSANTAMLHPEDKPMRPVQPVCNAFGIMGNARHREYDVRYLGRGDVDWTLRTLLEDRVVYADVRYYFDCGNVFGGRGGNVGLVTPEVFANTSRALKAKWRKNVSFKAPAFAKKRDVAPISIKVIRTNKTAQK